MGKLTDIQIRAWIKNGEHFEGRSDGDGLYLSFPENYSSPMWRFRYRFAGNKHRLAKGKFLAEADVTFMTLTKMVCSTTQSLPFPMKNSCAQGNRMNAIVVNC